MLLRVCAILVLCIIFSSCVTPVHYSEGAYGARVYEGKVVAITSVDNKYLDSNTTLIRIKAMQYDHEDDSLIEAKSCRIEIQYYESGQMIKRRCIYHSDCRFLVPSGTVRLLMYQAHKDLSQAVDSLVLQSQQTVNIEVILGYHLSY